MVTIGVDIIRVYQDPGRRRGEHRVLVDRLWPRGVRKEALDHDEWAKEVAPSTELRRWYGHEPERFAEFARRYRSELRKAPAKATVDRLRDVSAHRRLILLTATKDVEHSGAAVLGAVVQRSGR